MTRRLLLSFFSLTCAVLLVAAPGALAAKRASKAPAIKTVSPMRAKVGSTITLRGRNFRSKTRGNTVIFRSPGKRTVFVKPIRAAKKKLVVRVPEGLEELLSERDDAPVATRFSIRVLAGKFSKFTKRGQSPVIVSALPAPEKKKGSTAPKKPSAPKAPSGAPKATSCRTGTDTDGDLLADTLEDTLKTNACDKDSDNDGVEDGFEYKSAVDLNDDEFQEPNSSLPYPGKRPYPNPLDPSDAIKDFDGDSLTSLEEQELWKYVGGISLTPMSYSAGEKYSVATRNGSGRRVPSLAAAGYAKQANFLSWASSANYRNVVLAEGPPFANWYDESAHGTYGLLDVDRSGTESARESTYYDFNGEVTDPHAGDGFLSDQERDEDADGLTNFDETHGPLSRAAWWTSCYADAQEKPFPVEYAGTDFTDPDTDGDLIRDGADDQDHDDIPNVMELSRYRASGYGVWDGAGWCNLAENAPEPARGGLYGRVNPFNPCLPNPRSRTCPDYVEFEGGFAPFDDSPDWYSLN